MDITDAEDDYAIPQFGRISFDSNSNPFCELLPFLNVRKVSYVISLFRICLWDGQWNAQGAAHKKKSPYL